MNGVNNTVDNTSFFNELYKVASNQTGEANLGLDQKVDSNVPLAGRRIMQLKSDTEGGNNIRRILVDGLKNAGDSDALNDIRKELLGPEDANASKPVPKPLALRAIRAIRAQSANVDVLINRAVTVAKVPDAAREILKKVIAQHPDNKHIAEFLNSYSNNKLNLEAFRCVCKLAADAKEGDRLGLAYLKGFAGDVKVEEALDNSGVKEMEAMGKDNRVAQDEYDKKNPNRLQNKVGDGGLKNEEVSKDEDKVLVRNENKANVNVPVLNPVNGDLTKTGKIVFKAPSQSVESAKLEENDGAKKKKPSATQLIKINDHSVTKAMLEQDGPPEIGKQIKVVKKDDLKPDAELQKALDEIWSKVPKQDQQDKEVAGLAEWFNKMEAESMNLIGNAIATIKNTDPKPLKVTVQDVFGDIADSGTGVQTFQKMLNDLPGINQKTDKDLMDKLVDIFKHFPKSMREWMDDSRGKQCAGGDYICRVVFDVAKQLGIINEEKCNALTKGKVAPGNDGEEKEVQQKNSVENNTQNVIPQAEVIGEAKVQDVSDENGRENTKKK